MAERAVRGPARWLPGGLALLAAALAFGGCNEGGPTAFVLAGGDVVVDSIAMEPATGQVEVGGTFQFTATAFDAAGDTAAVELTWASGDASVATVTQDGLATGVASGQATISASAGEATASALLNVTSVEQVASPPGS